MCEGLNEIKSELKMTKIKIENLEKKVSVLEDINENIKILTRSQINKDSLLGFFSGVSFFFIVILFILLASK